MRGTSRLTSGVDGLDQILDGGFIEGASYIILGQPGAGKTILSNQIAFNHVAQGGRVLYVTLLSESHEHLFQALDSMRFFDRSRLGREIIYVSVFQTLRDQGLGELVKLLRKETKRHQATLLVFDGLLNARDRAATDFDVKSFVAEVQGQAAFVGCTVLFLTSSSSSEVSPEHTMVDGVIELTDSIAGLRSIRQLQVRKSRGSRALDGLHKFEITTGGIITYPRLESLPPSRGADVAGQKLSTGLGPLDEILGGGLAAGSVTLIGGPTGSGKTSLGLHFLSRSGPAEPGLHFGFFEAPGQLRQKAAALGIGLPADDGGLTIERTPLAENLVDKLAHRLISQVRALGARRLFLDGLGGFERASVHPARLPEFFATLMDRLRAEGVTTVATWEMRDLLGGQVRLPYNDISATLDNLILLRQVEEDHALVRSISIQKVRSSGFDPAARALKISDRGLIIGDPLSLGAGSPSSR